MQFFAIFSHIFQVTFIQICLFYTRMIFEIIFFLGIKNEN